MKLQDYVTSGNQKYLGNKYRDARFAFFQEKIEKLKKPITILDVGGTEKYWIHRGYQDNRDIQITLLNIEKISTSHSNILNIVGDATDLSMFRENEFDVVFSNSVIEHLYTFSNQKKMADEVNRVGAYHFIQTPNKLFFLEPHYLLPFIQFAPPGLKYFILTKTRLSKFKKWDEEFAQKYIHEIRLLTLNEMKKLFPASSLYLERFLGLIKSFTAHNFFDQ